MQKEKITFKVGGLFFILILTNLVRALFFSYERDYFIQQGFNELINPTLLLIQFGVLLPIVLKISNTKVNELGINFKNIKPGFIIAIKYFLWIIILETAIKFIQSYPSYSTFASYHWPLLRFISTGLSEFLNTLSSVLWEEIIPRGLFWAYLVKQGFDLDLKVKFIKINKAVLVSSLLFGLMHISLLLNAKNLSGIQNFFIYMLGCVLVGYMLGLIRKKTGSLFWPIIMHTAANYAEWLVAVMIPIMLVN